MKKILLPLVFLFFNNLFSQENIVKASSIVGNIGVQYERSLSPHFSVVGQVGYSMTRIFINDNDYSSTGIGYYVEGRYYFSKNNALMEGWHIGPYYNSINTKSKELNDAKTTMTSLGITAGYQWQTDSGFAFGLIFGGGNLDFKSDIPQAESFLGDINFLPNLGLTLGYNF
ncbi:DUF3575 domain-containing protein [Flavobacterium haoranii]|uniref:DUF3575 domain-containing protein n=1 Tax=Flavobacterium haoranii TaxID=683124 RepID=A0A1M6H750_9FLAO|nr:DUF3575 domain-containing protein [Flavobacterium haoranii]SHJ17933.1 Protein of unknown function [Flavobacterium haoranii]